MVYHLENLNIAEIPDQAFDGMIELIRIMIINNKLLKTIGQNISRDLKHILSIYLNDNQIDTIADNAFTTDAIQCDSVDINLDNNKLNVNQMDIFRHINYTFDLIIANNNITYLDESIFGPILRNYSESYVFNNCMDCNDCRNVWLIRDVEIAREVEKNLLKCSDGLKFISPEHFIGC